MNILFDHQTFCIQKYGGISRYFFELANHLNQLHPSSVEIFAPLYINGYFSEKIGISPNGLRLPDVIPQKLSRRLSYWVNVAAFTLSKHNANIFHETYYSLVDCRPPHAKRVITVFDMIHEKFPDDFSIFDRTREIKARAIRRADHIICISENTKIDLIELLGVSEEKVSVTYLGNSFNIDSLTTKASTRKSNKPYLLYIGNRVKYKNFTGLLKAYSGSELLKNEFSIVCFGGGNFSTAELALIKSMGIAPENVIYTVGSDKVLSELYQSAAAFVYPSLYEGFGIPPLEAMSCCCPVVCSNTSSLPEVVGEAAALFTPSDFNDIRLTIEKVVSSPVYSSQLIEKGRQRIKMFSWDKCAQDTLNVYHRLLND